MVCDTIEHVDSVERVRIEKDAYHDNYVVKLLLFQLHIGNVLEKYTSIYSNCVSYFLEFSFRSRAVYHYFLFALY